MSGAPVTTTGLTKAYGDLTALAPLDLTVSPGQLVVLIGHNGAGKTTLLDMLAGLLQPSGGDALIQTAPAGSLEARRALSYIPDTPVLYEDLSLAEHARYIAGLHGVEDWEPAATRLMERLRLAHRAEDLPIHFSRGLRQKTSLLLGLIRPFSVLLVDEPMVGLDAPARATFLELVDEATRRGAAVVVSTHQLDLLERATRCLALRDGELVYDGPARGADAEQLVSGVTEP